MSDWRSRAVPAEAPAGDWRSRAQPADDNLGVPDSPLRKALAEQTGEIVTVQTPQGPVRMTRQGGRVMEPDEVHNWLAAPEAYWKERKLKQALSLIDTASNGLVRKVGDAGEVQQAARDFPVENFAGNFVVPTPGPGKTKAGATVLSKALTAAAPAATVGGLNAFGRTTDDQSTGEKIAQTLEGAGAGGVIGAGFGAGGAALTKTKDALRAAAEEHAVKAFTKPGISDKLARLGLDAEGARRLARWALDNGIIKFGDSADRIAKRAEELIDKEGDAIGAALGAADATGKVPDFTEAGTAVLDSLKGRTGVALQGRGHVDELAEALANEQNPSFRQLWKAKHDAQGNVNWSTTTKGAGELLRDATGALRQNTYDQLGRVLPADQAAELAKSAQTYSQAAKVLPLAMDKASREVARSTGSLSGKMVGARVAGELGGLGGELAAEGVIAGDKFFARHGQSMAAKALDTAGSAAGLGARAAPLLENPTAQADAVKVAAWLKALRGE